MGIVQPRYKTGYLNFPKERRGTSLDVLDNLLSLQSNHKCKGNMPNPELVMLFLLIASQLYWPLLASQCFVDPEKYMT